MDHSQYIIDKLEEARDERGMPIAELARRSGIHRKRLWYILNGKRKLRADEFVRLIVIMGTPITTYIPTEMLDALSRSHSNWKERGTSGLERGPSPTTTRARRHTAGRRPDGITSKSASRSPSTTTSACCTTRCSRTPPGRP